MFEKPYSLETNPDTISRVVVGSKGTMPNDAGMKPPKRTELSSPEIETDLSRIQSLSREHDEENWEFRSWLKQNAPDDIDGIVQALSQKYFALIDCTQCANCCRSLQAEFKKSELHTIAETLGQSIKEFEKQFMSEGIVNPPCPMLDGRLCSIYDNRPEVCRSFPHLEKPLFTSRLMGVIDNVAICPIAFNAYEELKTKLAWPKGRRDLRR
jgi:Fe-S-cluster containining protein